MERKRQTTEQMKKKVETEATQGIYTMTETCGLCHRSEDSFGMQIPTASIIIPGMFINKHSSLNNNHKFHHKPFLKSNF